GRGLQGRPEAAPAVAGRPSDPRLAPVAGGARHGSADDDARRRGAAASAADAGPSLEIGQDVRQILRRTNVIFLMLSSLLALQDKPVQKTVEERLKELEEKLGALEKRSKTLEDENRALEKTLADGAKAKEAWAR